MSAVISRCLWNTEDEKLKEYLENAPSKARYCSHMIQNELIDLCGKQIQDTVLKKCRDAQWFSLLADETAEVMLSK